MNTKSNQEPMRKELATQGGQADAKFSKIPPKIRSIVAALDVADIKRLAAKNEPDALKAALQALEAKDAGLAATAKYIAGLNRLPPSPRPKRPSALKVDVFNAELKRLKASREVADLLTASAFWHGLSTKGTEWTAANGSVGNAITLSPTGSTSPWTSPTLSIDSAAYMNAASGVIAKQAAGNIKNSGVQSRIYAAADYPHLLLFDMLGMLDEPTRYEQTCALVDAAIMICGVAVHRLKYLIQAPRPKALVEGILTPTTIDPQFTAYPGGHASVCALLASLLSSLSGGDRSTGDALHALARSIAEDRELAGLHSALDTEDGLTLGKSMGQWLADLATEPTAPISWAATFAQATHEWT